jgi:poly-gamma-glutamate capsule biosynthesis protein CapA/YwtB (metallophosphatase superfamily)
LQKIFQFFFVVIGIIVILTACSPQVKLEPSGMITPSVDKTISTEFTPPTSVPATLSLPSLTSSPTKVTSPTPTSVPHTVIAFTGVIVPARCVQAEIDRQGRADYIYDEVRDILESADITVGTYNAVMSDQVEPVGCEHSWELVGSPVNADALQRAGFDVMSVSTNHIMDCGKQSCGTTAFFDTLFHLKRVGILPVGAGRNLADAKKPVIVEVNGLRFGFVSLGEVNEKVFANAVTPGIAELTLENLNSAIAEAREAADVVIVLPHSGPEDYPEMTPQQNFWARHSVEAGANLVVINHAHIVQGYQWMGEVPVFYSLGNFVFDQVWARDHQQGMILLVTFEGVKIIEFELIPTVVDQDGTVHLANGEEKEEILSRVEGLSKILNNGG